jgi:hypothetical protein
MSHAREVPQELELPQTMWSMIVLSAIGQVQTENGQPVSAYVIFATAVLTSMVQLAILLLLLTDIDPNAKPVVVHPVNEWGGAWTVNTMKWLMAIVLCVALSSELHEIKTNLKGSWFLNPSRIQTNKMLLPASAAIQYIVTLCVVWAAMSVILSFQTCPDIIYSSLAITFVSTIDDMYYTFTCTAFDLEVDFLIKFKSKDRQLPRWLHFTLKLAGLFPLLLGIYLVARAFHTGHMPYARFQTMQRYVLGNLAT